MEPIHSNSDVDTPTTSSSSLNIPDASVSHNTGQSDDLAISLSDLDLTALVNELQRFDNGSISFTNKSSEPLELPMDFFSYNMPSFNDFVDFSGSSLF